MRPVGTEPGHPKGHHPDEVPFVAVVLIATVTMIFAGGLCVWAWGMLHVREGHLRPSRDFPEQRLGPPKERQGVIEQSFYWETTAQKERERARRQLSTFGWIDRDRRLVHIPIDDAMRIVAGEAR